MSRPSPDVRRQVQQRARNLCEYCRTLLALTGHEFTTDHILPEALGSTSELINLASAVSGATTTNKLAPTPAIRVPIGSLRSSILVATSGKTTSAGVPRLLA